MKYLWRGEKKDRLGGKRGHSDLPTLYLSGLSFRKIRFHDSFLVAFVQMFFPDFFIFRFVTRDVKYPAGKSIYSLLSPFLFGDTCMYEI